MERVVVKIPHILLSSCHDIEQVRAVGPGREGKSLLVLVNFSSLVHLISPNLYIMIVSNDGI